MQKFQEHPHGAIAQAIATELLIRMGEATQIYDTFTGSVGQEYLARRQIDAQFQLGYQVKEYSVLILEFMVTSQGVTAERFVHHEVPKDKVVPLSQLQEVLDTFEAAHANQLYPGTDMPVKEVRAWLGKLLLALDKYCVGCVFATEVDQENVPEHMRDLLAIFFLLKDDWEDDQSTQRVMQLVWSGPTRLQHAIDLARKGPGPDDLGIMT